MAPRRKHFGDRGPINLLEVIKPRESAAEPTVRIAIDRIDPSPRNPRETLGGIDELAGSIRTYGLLQPIVVRDAGSRYILIAGHRRLAAIQQLHGQEPEDQRWREVDAIIRGEGEDEAYLLTLTENLQREDLRPDEEAQALGVLIRERGWSVRKVAEAIHRDHLYVSRRLRVFEDPILREPVLREQLPVSTAEILLRVKDEGRRSQLLQETVAQGWGQADVRRALRVGWGVTPHPRSHDHIDEHSEALLRLAGELQALLAEAPPEEISAQARTALRDLVQQLRAFEAVPEHAP